MRGILLTLALSVVASPAVSAPLPTSAGRVEVKAVVSGLTEPWALGFLPDDGILITERAGRLLHRRGTGEVLVVAGVPEVVAVGQGGLLDIMVPRDFAASREVFLSYSKRQGLRGSGTALAVGRLNEAGDSLTRVRTIFEMTPGSSGGKHFGSRIVEAPDGTIFLSIGDRGDRPSAQDRARHNGSIVRINRDGSVPRDNPFLGVRGVRPEIWSWGHRNPQGLALDGRGRLWSSEHGARGGDEVNQIRKGTNYGWPVISYGRHYSGLKIGEGTAKPGMAQPEFYWDPSMAPSGMMIYSGRLWPEWRGDIFVGSLKFDYIARLDGMPLRETEQIKSPATERVRDVREAPDGTVWFLSVGQGALFRIAPAGH